MEFFLVNERIRVTTQGECQVVDLTPDLVTLLKKHEIGDGHINVFVPGSTAGLTTIEFEPGLLKDLPIAFDRLAPRDGKYHHNDTWQDGNGHSHIRAAFIGPSLTVPIESGEMVLGTWQQVVLVDFDNRPRQRKLVVQLFGNRKGATT